MNLKHFTIDNFNLHHFPSNDIKNDLLRAYVALVLGGEWNSLPYIGKNILADPKVLQHFDVATGAPQYGDVLVDENYHYCIYLDPKTALSSDVSGHKSKMSLNPTYIARQKILRPKHQAGIYHEANTGVVTPALTEVSAPPRLDLYIGSRIGSGNTKDGIFGRLSDTSFLLPNDKVALRHSVSRRVRSNPDTYDGDYGKVRKMAVVTYDATSVWSNVYHSILDAINPASLLDKKPDGSLSYVQLVALNNDTNFKNLIRFNRSQEPTNPAPKYPQSTRFWWGGNINNTSLIRTAYAAPSKDCINNQVVDLAIIRGDKVLLTSNRYLLTAIVERESSGKLNIKTSYRGVH